MSSRSRPSQSSEDCAVHIQLSDLLSRNGRAAGCLAGVLTYRCRETCTYTGRRTQILLVLSCFLVNHSVRGRVFVMSFWPSNHAYMFLSVCMRIFVGPYHPMFPNTRIYTDTDKKVDTDVCRGVFSICLCRRTTVEGLHLVLASPPPT